MKRDAVIYDPYRYNLTRDWAGGRQVAFVMLNPSTADALVDDPTIRRCIGFAKDWGYGRLVVINLFAYRTSQPSVLKYVTAPVGALNGYFWRKVLRDPSVDDIIAAWGAWDGSRSASRLFARIAEDRPIRCLGTTKHGYPKHPLYLAKNTKRREFQHGT